MQKKNQYFKGKLLIAMPDMADPRFSKSVIFLCAHDYDGAMGVVINQQADDITGRALLDQLNIETDIDFDLSVFHGGPLEPSRGLVLHSEDYNQKNTMEITDGICITGTIEVLKDMADRKGPKDLLFTLGYAGWSAGQLDAELQQNAWLVADATPALLFSTPTDMIWEQAISTLGIDPSMLFSTGGTA